MAEQGLNYKALIQELTLHAKKSKKARPLSLLHLLEILQYALQSEKKRDMFTGELVSAWFVQLGEINFGTVSADAMIIILDRLIRLEINAGDEFPKFYQGWEHVVYQKFVEQDLLPVLKVYNLDKAVMPKETFEKWVAMALKMMNENKMRKWSHLDYIYLLYGLSVQELMPENGLVNEWFDRCDKRLEGLETRQLAQYIYVAGKYSVTLSDQRKELLARCIDRKMNEFEGKDFMITVYGFSLHPENLDEKHFGNFLKDFHWKIKIFCADLGMHSVAKLWYGVAKLEKAKVLDEPGMFSLALGDISRVVTHKIAGAYAGDVWMLLDALKIQFDNRTLMKVPVGMKTAVIASVENNYKSLWPSALARLICRMEWLKMRPDEYFVTKLWLPEVKKVLEVLFVDEMLEILIGLVVHGVNLPTEDAEFAELWFQVAEKQKAGYFSIKNARAAKYYFERLGVATLPEDFEHRLHLDFQEGSGYR